MQQPELMAGFNDTPTTIFTDSFSGEVWHSTYKDHNDNHIDNTLGRTAKFAASAEKTEAKQKEWEGKFYDMLSQFKCTAGGRIYANAGTEWGGTTLMNCFSPDAMVLTSTGMKPINSIEVGEYVLTHKGRFKQVINVLMREYQGPVQRFCSTYFTSDVVVTPEHPFYQGNDCWINASNLSYVTLANSHQTEEDKHVYDLASMFTREIENGTVVATDTILYTKQPYVGGNGANGMKYGQSINRFVTLSTDFAYLLGRFVGDGCTFKNNKRSHFDVDAFTVAFNTEKEQQDVERLVELFEQTLGIQPNVIHSSNNTTYVRKASQLAAQAIRNLIGAGFETKHIPSTLWMSNKDIQLSFLGGLFDADGFVTSKGFLQLEMTNQQLITDVQTMLLMCDVPTSRRGTRLFGGSTHTASFRSVLNKHYDDERLIFESSKSPTTGPKPVPGEGIQSVVPECFDEEYDGFVYNLSVEDDESYVVNNIIVHNCFVSPRPSVEVDSLAGIVNDVLSQCQTLKSEGGWGQNFSFIRPRGAFIGGIGVETPGAVKYMEVYDKTSDVITSGSGRKNVNKKAKGKIRKGAMMGVLDVWHPDIIEFITAKQQPGRLTKFNISVNCTDQFMERVARVQELIDQQAPQEQIDAADQWTLKFPDTTHPAYDEEWDGDIHKWERKGYAVDEYRTVSAMWLWNLIMESTYNRAEPGVLFLDRANHFNPLNYRETIFATNPCGEQTLAPGGVCNLGSLNLTQFVNEDQSGFNLERIEKYTKYLNRFLDNINSLSNAPLDEYIDSMKNKRRVGIGILGWGSALFMLKTRFGSEEAAKLREQVMETIAKAAYRSSIDLAEEKGMFKYCEPEKHARNPFIQSLQLEDEYVDKLKTTGIRNSSLLSIQPTGNTSILANVTSGGLEPIFMPEYVRTVIVGHTPDDIAEVTPNWNQGEWYETEMFKFEKEGDEDILKGTAPDGTVYKIDQNRGLTKEVLCQDYGVRWLSERDQWDPNADWAITALDLSVQDHVNDVKGFARWVDSAMSKCVAEGTLISTNKGVVPIESIGSHDHEQLFQDDTFVEPNDNYRVVDHNGDYKSITSHYCGGSKPCATIRFDNGFELTAAYTHKLMTSDGWKPFGEIRPQEKVFYRTSVTEDRQEYVSVPPIEFASNAVNTTFPSLFDEDFAMYVGMWLADGYSSPNSISICEKNETVGAVIEQLHHSLFGTSKTQIDGRWDVVTHYVHSRSISRWFTEQFGSGAANKRVPEWILRSPQSVFRAFLSGLTLDGYVKRSTYSNTLIVFDGYAKDVADKAIAMLSDLGIQYSLMTRTVGDGHTTYGVTAWLTDYDTIVPVEEHKQMYDVCGKSQKQIYVSDAEFETLLEQQPNTVHGSIMRARIRACKKRGNFVRLSFLDTVTLQPVDRDLTCVTVTDVIDAGYKDVYDIEVEDTHSYLINGIVSHNTVNVPHDYSFEGFKDIYLQSYASGYVKGVTTYRSGTMTTVLSAKEEKDADATDEEIIAEDVKLPDQMPASMTIIRAENKKWYLTTVMNEQQTRPVAFFVHTNSHEKTVQAMDAVEKLLELAHEKGIPEQWIYDTEQKLSKDSNATKIARAISLLLRHGVLIKHIVTTLDRVEDAFIGSFVFQIRKYLSTYIKEGEKLENESCPECGGEMMFSEGCTKCISCGNGKC